MPNREHFERMARSLHLTPYQLYMLEQNAYKYNLRKLIKRGNVLYAPYKSELSRGFRDGIRKIVLGARADLIGPDRMLAIDQRGLKLERYF
jgi:hypothetical protein